ncbi:BsuBI/PstI family type II restriction endonuclease [Pyruvatibacter sp.]|uniref:BsuBI/PstI family type II restriction endonuclease n=1 Tax=Pyruvatibacter sp. TaxID=1981328 RepID=UPI0032EE4387
MTRVFVASIQFSTLYAEMGMALDGKVQGLRERRVAEYGRAVSDQYQGVTKDKIRRVLRHLDLQGNNDLIDAVFALLDDETLSWFSKAPKGSTLSDGASTAHLACHIGILQRGAGKLDREGRDYWIKPLRDLGGIEAVTLDRGEFVPGHTKAKSPNSSYRLEAAFREILTAPDGEWQESLDAWAASEMARERLAFQAKMAAAAKAASDTGHAALINDCVEYYAPRFLAGYEVLYVDDSDGDRISPEERAKMEAAGAVLTLADPMPDVLLRHPETDWLWVIEAVTSDGEVDAHKVKGMQAFAHRCGKAGVGFTTAYRTWKEAAARQGAQRNVAVNTYIWIRDDPAKQLLLSG